MIDEEKKNETIQEGEIKEEVVEDIDSDFADDHPYVPEPPKEEPKQEAPEGEEKKDPMDIEADVVIEDEEEIPEEAQQNSEYDDPALSKIEEARALWIKDFKLHSRIRTILSIVVILAMLGGGLLPIILIKNQGMVPVYIGLGVAIAGAVALLIYNTINRRRDQRKIAEYFDQFYGGVNEYVYPYLGVTNYEGGVVDKVSPEEFKAGGAFGQVASIGSRDNVTFEYQGMDCAIADAAAQKDNGKALETIFVGKFLRTSNKVKVCEEGILIYFKGNDRALVPNTLEGRHALEKSKTCIIYGRPEDRNALTQKQKKAIRQIRTDSLLVDVTIVIKNEKTYWYLGYEDDIMVLPSQKPFDPSFVKRYRNQLQTILEAAKLLNE